MRPDRVSYVQENTTSSRQVISFLLLLCQQFSLFALVSILSRVFFHTGWCRLSSAVRQHQQGRAGRQEGVNMGLTCPVLCRFAKWTSGMNSTGCECRSGMVLK